MSKVFVRQNSKVIDLVKSTDPYAEIKTKHGTLFLYRTQSSCRLYVVIDGFHGLSFEDFYFFVEPLGWFGDLVDEIIVSMFPEHYACTSPELYQEGVVRDYSARRLSDGTFEYDALVNADH